MTTIWVIGGPGSGKGTQCERIIEKFGFLHLSSGDLLRAEVSSGTDRGKAIEELMTKGLFVPTEIVLDLIKENMDKEAMKNAAKAKFLIDGYPREKEQGILFEQKVCPVDLILFFDVSDETMKKRLLGRAATSVNVRADDREEVILKRIDIFNVKNKEIMDHYKDKVVNINAEGTPDEIFVEVTKVLNNLLKSKAVTAKA